ncbi:MAG: assembly factor cbp4 [Alectoria sarmentosa]|nr:MAG: assembly factor cbp4 [Alectoria sarmentosa]CAD6590741.1 MAG: assembly factor cbp4 [Alectoria sarmentosa]
MSKAALWFKMLSTGVILCVGGPALVYWKYNPELQKRSLENREQKQQDFDNFVNKLKEYSKSDKPIWTAAAEDEARQRANNAEEQQRIAHDIQRRREKIRDESLQR